jgi:hypothetical protein
VDLSELGRQTGMLPVVQEDVKPTGRKRQRIGDFDAELAAQRLLLQQNDMGDGLLAFIRLVYEQERNASSGHISPFSQLFLLQLTTVTTPILPPGVTAHPAPDGSVAADGTISQTELQHVLLVHLGESILSQLSALTLPKSGGHLMDQQVFRQTSEGLLKYPARQVYTLTATGTLLILRLTRWKTKWVHGKCVVEKSRDELMFPDQVFLPAGMYTLLGFGQHIGSHSGGHYVHINHDRGCHNDEKFYTLSLDEYNHAKAHADVYLYRLAGSFSLCIDSA